jgi:hypothetical protein
MNASWGQYSPQRRDRALKFDFRMFVHFFPSPSCDLPTKYVQQRPLESVIVTKSGLPIFVVIFERFYFCNLTKRIWKNPSVSCHSPKRYFWKSSFTTGNDWISIGIRASHKSILGTKEYFWCRKSILGIKRVFWMHEKVFLLVKK